MNSALTDQNPADQSSTISKESISSKQTPSSCRPEQEALDELSSTMLNSTGEYIKSEIDICIADYNTLEKMNRTVADKYQNLADISGNINVEMNKLNDTYCSLQAMLVQIDDLEGCIGQLEKSASKLDDYSKRLEHRYKQIQEKFAAK